MKRILIFTLLFLVQPLVAQAFETTGFVHPYGVAVDPKTNLIFVSNMNGPGEKKDDNGFISRLQSDGTVMQMKFIDGAKGNVRLNAPKGMAVIGNFLYVADIDTIRVFDLAKATELFQINFGDYKINHFYGLAIGPDGALYAADGPANTIYRIDVMKEHRVTPFIVDESLGEPHSLVWYQLRQRFLIAGWESGQVLAYDREGKKVALPGIFLNMLEGLAVDLRGNSYVSSTALAAVYRLSPSGIVFSYQGGVDTPLGITYQKVDNQILVVSYRRGSLSSYPAVK
jgi:DNA-binding beta-propeller fold protein YncE